MGSSTIWSPQYEISPISSKPMSKYRSVSTLISSSGSNLESLLERAQYLQNLTHILRENIDPVLSQHIALANLRVDTAIIVADSPAWLSKIRYLSPLILQILKQQHGLEHLINIEFKVQPPGEPIDVAQKARQINLSTSSTEALEGAADGISDPELADALRRLSQRGKTQPD